MKKYTVTPNRGELAYGQPSWAVRLTPEEVARLCDPMNTDAHYLVDMLCIKSSKVTTTIEEEGQPTRVLHSTNDRHLRTLRAVVVTRWRKKYSNAGLYRYTTPIPGTPYSRPYMMLGRYDDLLAPAREIVETFRCAIVRCQSAQEAADCANYFGDRLPAAFYAHYKEQMHVL